MTTPADPSHPNADLELYFWPTPNGWKVTIFLEEAGLPYRLSYVDIGQGEQFEPDFLKISPNNRMPALVDHGAEGGPLSIFDSGAILQYLGRKTGQFYPTDERARVEVEQWLFWQISGVGPMAGQAHHFLNYARTDVEYAKQRYTDEVNRLYGVLDARLADRDYVAGDYSIADMAIWPWAQGWMRQGQTEADIDELPHFKAWLDRVAARPEVQAGKAVGEEKRKQMNLKGDDKQHSVLFGQRARKRT